MNSALPFSLVCWLFCENNGGKDAEVFKAHVELLLWISLFKSPFLLTFYGKQTPKTTLLSLLLILNIVFILNLNESIWVFDEIIIETACSLTPLNLHLQIKIFHRKIPKWLLLSIHPVFLFSFRIPKITTCCTLYFAHSRALSQCSWANIYMSFYLYRHFNNYYIE